MIAGDEGQEPGNLIGKEELEQVLDDAPQTNTPEIAAVLLRMIIAIPARGRVTVADCAARWLDSQTGIKPSTLYRYGTLLRAHVLPAGGLPAG